MIDLGYGLKLKKEKIEDVLNNLNNINTVKIYAVVASRIPKIHKCDLLIDTSEDILIFGDELWNKPLFQSWTDDAELYKNGGTDILVKEVKLTHEL